MTVRPVRAEIAFYADRNARAAEHAALSMAGTARAGWLADEAAKRGHEIVPPTRPLVVPQAFRKTAPPDEVAELGKLLERLSALCADMVGLNSDEASVLHHADPEVLALREAMVAWGERHVARRLRKGHPKDGGDAFRTYYRLATEIVAAWEEVAFAPGSGHNVVLGTSADLLAWRLYDATWRAEVEIRHTEGQVTVDFPPARAGQRSHLIQLIRLYAWSEMDQVDRTIAWSGDRLRRAEGSRDHLSARAQLLADDLLEMKPLLIRGFRPERHVVEVARGLWGSFVWSVGDASGFFVLGEREEEVLTQLNSGNLRRAAALRLDGRFGPTSLPWLSISDDELGWSVAVLEAMHAHLYGAYEKADRGLAGRAAERDAWTESIEVAAACAELVERSPAPEADVLEVRAGRPHAVGAVRMGTLLRMLESKLGCEVANGKGSEVTVYRPGGKKFTLGHHHRHRHVPSHVVRLLLRRVGIAVEEWSRAVGDA